MPDVGRITFGPKSDKSYPIGPSDGIWASCRQTPLAMTLNKLRIQPERENAVLVREGEIARWNDAKKAWE